MRAEELRIGNLIYNPVQKINLVVDGSLIATESMREKAIKDYKGFEPIPLAEDWLVKFGLLKPFEEDNPSFTNQFGVMYWIQCTKRGDFILHQQDGEHFSLQRINHVHQLQNLYFALTGEELKIKNK